MHVALKSNFDVKGMLGAEGIDLPEGASVRNLLDLLAERCRLELIDSGSGQVNSSDFTILLNGKEQLFWPKGLATPLRDADEVQLLVMPLAGG